MLYREFQRITEMHDPCIDGKSQDAQLHRFKSFGSQVTAACTESERVIVLGDFNINIQKQNDLNYYLPRVLQEYESIMGENGLSFKRFGITFERIHTSGKLIQSEVDHLITNCPDEIKDFETFPFDDSDHKGIMAEICFEIIKPEKKV